MRHWSVDTTELEKDPQAYAIWRLEQRINFGLGEEKVKEAELRQYWSQLDLDPHKKKFLGLILAH